MPAQPTKRAEIMQIASNCNFFMFMFFCGLLFVGFSALSVFILCYKGTAIFLYVQENG